MTHESIEVGGCAPPVLASTGVEHELKTDPAVFDAVAAGLKTFEIRKFDRDFRVGDTLVLKKTQHTGEEMKAGAPLIYTGGIVRKVISHRLLGPEYGLAEKWAILSFAHPTPPATDARVMELEEAINQAIKQTSTMRPFLFSAPANVSRRVLRNLDVIDCTLSAALAARKEPKP